jgi:hypothetical protein
MWADYTRFRHDVEKEYGLSLEEVRRIVDRMLAREAELDIQWFFLEVANARVGAVGALRFLV